MKLSNGASIAAEDGSYTYEHEHLTIEDYPLEEFVDELQDLGVIDDFLISVSGSPQEVFAISSSHFEPQRQEESEPDLETCYEKVIEDLNDLQATTDVSYDSQVKTLGVLQMRKYAISNK